MNLKEIKELIEVVNSSELAYFEVKVNDTFIKMDKSLTRAANEISKTTETKTEKESSVQDIKSVEVKEEVKQEIKEIEGKEEVGEIIKCPMVGTFYASPSPDKDSFVKEGSKASKGKVLCIVEAMKLMNEIECEFDCEIIKVLVKDGDMVEYGQPLFKVRRV